MPDRCPGFLPDRRPTRVQTASSQPLARLKSAMNAFKPSLQITAEKRRKAQELTDLSSTEDKYTEIDSRL